MTVEPNDDELEAQLIELFNRLSPDAKVQVLEQLETIVALEEQNWSVQGFTADVQILFNLPEEDP